MDEDLQQMNKDQLMQEVKKLRAGIREHRDSTGPDLCWHHPKLWSLSSPQEFSSFPRWSLVKARNDEISGSLSYLSNPAGSSSFPRWFFVFARPSFKIYFLLRNADRSNPQPSQFYIYQNLPYLNAI